MHEIQVGDVVVKLSEMKSLAVVSEPQLLKETILQMSADSLRQAEGEFSDELENDESDSFESEDELKIEEDDDKSVDNKLEIDELNKKLEEIRDRREG
jgi:hypothetical protein